MVHVGGGGVDSWTFLPHSDCQPKCPHCVSQLFIYDFCVYKQSFIFMEYALVSVVMPLRCYA